MTDDTNTLGSGMPAPDPALKALDRLVGKWKMSGHLVGSDEEILTGVAAYEWLPGGFFLKQHVKMNFGGLDIDSTEFIGFDAETQSLKSSVFSNLSPVPLPYFWRMDGDNLEITVSYPPLDATFRGKFSVDGTRLRRRLAAKPRRRPDRECCLRHYRHAH